MIKWFRQCWLFVVGVHKCPTLIHASVWNAEINVLVCGLFEVWHYKTETTVHETVPFEEWTPGLLHVVFVSLWGGGGGGLWVEPTMNCGNPWRVAAEPIKEKSILFFWNSPRPQTCINRFCLIIAQPYHSNYVFKSKLSTNWTMFECCLNRVRCKCLNKLAAGTSRPIKASHLTRRQN